MEHIIHVSGGVLKKKLQISVFYFVYVTFYREAYAGRVLSMLSA